MTKSLQEVRAEWEKGLKIIAEVPRYIVDNIPKELDNLIVILKNEKDKYFIHRYFSTSAFSDFVVSVDLRLSNANDVLNFIEKTYPKGLKTNII